MIYAFFEVPGLTDMNYAAFYRCAVDITPKSTKRHGRSLEGDYPGFQYFNERLRTSLRSNLKSNLKSNSGSSP